MRITLEMPAVAAREMRECACNADDSCRAAAIRMGYGTLPSCDTMVPRTASINPDQALLAGVGSRKVSHCACQADLRCTAAHVAVDLVGYTVSCLTYAKRYCAAGVAGCRNPDKEPGSMSDIRIPENEWQTFCESFTRQHHGWLVGVCQVDTRDVAQAVPPARAPEQLFPGSRPLQELREGRTDDRSEVMVTVGEGADETSFLIQDTIAMYSRRSGAAHQGLRVDSGNGTTTLIEFRAAAQPETLDGLAESER